MYYIVEFESKDVEIVPSNWFEDGETLDVGESSFLAFPPKELPLRSLIRQNILPHSTWPTYTVTILYGHGKLHMDAKPLFNHFCITNKEKRGVIFSVK
jgi:hypothetical protein